MTGGVVVEAALGEMPPPVAEEVDGHQFLVGEAGLAVVAHALRSQVRAGIVSPADPQIELDELLFHKLNSTTPCGSAFLLLIRITVYCLLPSAYCLPSCLGGLRGSM